MAKPSYQSIYQQCWIIAIYFSYSGHQDKPHICQIPLLYPVEVSSDRQEFISHQEPQDPDFISFLPPAFHPSPFSHGLTYRLLSG